MSNIFDNRKDIETALASQVGGMSTPASLVQRLAQRKIQIQKQLQDIDEALNLLDKYPDIEKLINLLGRTNY